MPVAASFADLQDAAAQTAPASRGAARSGPLRAAVIGAGKISEEHLRFLGNSPHAVLTGVCDLSPAMARFGVDRFGHAGTTAAFMDHRRMLEEKRPAVVHVLTPPHTHVRLVTECLRAGAHVIVEKPAAPTNAEGLATFLDRTYAALREGAEPPVTFDEMDRASRLVDALLQERNRM
jgi:predicted dehydrogenase